MPRYKAIIRIKNDDPENTAWVKGNFANAMDAIRSIIITAGNDEKVNRDVYSEVVYVHCERLDEEDESLQ